MALGLSALGAIQLVDTALRMYQMMSFDGGGLRGYSSLLLIENLTQELAELEESLKKAYPDFTEYVDLESGRLKDTKKTMSTTTTDFSFMRSSRLCDGSRPPGYDKLCQQWAGQELPIWKAAQACSAAPFYFTPMSLDQEKADSLVQNNPCLLPAEMDRPRSPEDLSADLKFGCVKSKSGHTEAAAGTTSLIKALYRIREHLNFQLDDGKASHAMGSKQRKAYLKPTLGEGKAAAARQYIHDRRAVNEQSCRFRHTLEALAHSPIPGKKSKLSSDWATDLTESFRQTLAVKRLKEQDSPFQLEKEAYRKLDGDRDFNPERHTYPLKDHDHLPLELLDEMNKLVEQDCSWTWPTCFKVFPRAEKAMPLPIPLDGVLSARPWEVMLSFVDAVRSLHAFNGLTSSVLAQDWSSNRHSEIKPENILFNDLRRHRVDQSHELIPGEVPIIGMSCRPITTGRLLDDFWDLLRRNADIPGDDTAGYPNHAFEQYLHHLLKRLADMDSMSAQQWSILMTTLEAAQSAGDDRKLSWDQPPLWKARAVNPTLNRLHGSRTAAMRSRKGRRHQRSLARHRCGQRTPCSSWNRLN